MASDIGFVINTNEAGRGAAPIYYGNILNKKIIMMIYFIYYHFTP